MKLTSEEKASYDKSVAKVVYATNSPFRIVEHPTFRKLISDLRPGYTPPDRHRIAGELLDAVHTEVLAETKEALNNQIVCMSMDGWSNIHKESIICVAVTCNYKTCH